MNIAVPVVNNRLANHFAKAKAWHIFSPSYQRVATVALSPLNSCQAKKELLRALTEWQVNTIKVQKVGQCMLGKLLAKGFTVDKLPSPMLPLLAAQNPGQRLTHPEEGQVSKHKCAKQCQASACQHG